MDNRQFDRMARAAATSRRHLVGGLLGLAGGAALAGVEPVAAKHKPTHRTTKPKPPKAKVPKPGKGTAPQSVAICHFDEESGFYSYLVVASSALKGHRKHASDLEGLTRVDCEALNFCVGNPCDDGIACTVDSCDAGTQSCSNTPDNSLCGTDERCVAGVGCVPNVETNCTDGLDNDLDGAIDGADADCPPAT